MAPVYHHRIMGPLFNPPAIIFVDSGVIQVHSYSTGSAFLGKLNVVYLGFVTCPIVHVSPAAVGSRSPVLSIVAGDLKLSIQ